MKRYQVTGSVIIEGEESFDLIVTNQTVAAKNEDDAAKIVLSSIAKKYRQFTVGWDTTPEVKEEENAKV